MPLGEQLEENEHKEEKDKEDLQFTILHCKWLTTMHTRDQPKTICFIAFLNLPFLSKLIKENDKHR